MSGEAVQVIVRCRPLNKREKGLNCKVAVEIFSDVGQVQLVKHGSSDPPKKFTFDGAYGMDSNSQMIYEDVGFPLIESVLQGYNGTIFAYGQTGCGKSFTMEGIPDPPEHRGLTPRSFEHIFQEVAVHEHTNFLVRASYLEIYNENVRDLLGADQTAKLDLKEHPDKGVYVKGLSEHVVSNTQEILQLMADGSKNRSVGATLMNADSSRSHSIFTVWVEACETGEDGDEKLRASRLNLVDLAGSERQGKTGATGDRLKEATKINLSLSALGNVISALVDGKSKHIPYRDSKLTRLLQDSLGGNTKTLMMCALSPADNNYDETLSTLRYANRAKSIQNKAVINEDPKDALLRQYQEEIEKLKAMLTGQVPVEQAALLASGGAAPTTQPAAATSNQGASLSATDMKALEAKIRKEQEAEMKAKEEQLKQEYDQQLATLEQAYQEQKMSNEKLEEEFQRVTQQYNNKKVGLKTQVESNVQQELQGAQAAVVTSSDPSAAVDSVNVVRSPGMSSAPAVQLPEFEVIPQTYVVVDKAKEKVRIAVRQAGSRTFYRGILGPDGLIHPAVDSKGRPYAIKTAELAECEYLPSTSGATVKPMMAAVGEGRAVVALQGPDNEPVACQLTEHYGLEAIVDDDGEPELVLDDTGAPARLFNLTEDVAAVRLADQEVGLAYITEDGLPVELALMSNGKPQPHIDRTTLLGPDGLAAASVVSKHKSRLPARAVVVRDDKGKARCGIYRLDGTVVRAVLDKDSRLKPELNEDGQPKVISAKPLRPLKADSSVLQANSDAAPKPAVAAASENQQPLSQPSMPHPGAAVKDDPSIVAQLQKKLESLQRAMVAGGASSKAKLKQKLQSRRERAEAHRRRLQEAKEADDDSMMEAVFDNMHDEIKAKTGYLKRAKEIIKAQKVEIADLQAEFQRERQALLDNLRKNEQELMFYQAFVQHAVPCIKRSVNYSNLDKIRRVAVWDQESGRWIMPKVVASNLALPAAEGLASRNSSAHSRTHSGRSYVDFSDDDNEELREQLEASSLNGSAYFQGNRQSKLIDKVDERRHQLANQLQDRLARFDRPSMPTSSRAQQLLMDSGAAKSPRRRRKAEPGGVSLSNMIPRHRAMKPKHGKDSLGESSQGW